MKRRVVPNVLSEAGMPSHLAALESVLFDKLLPILTHCAVNRYDDNTPRTPGYVIVKTDGNLWKLIAKEPDAKLQLTTVGTTIDDAWSMLSLLLETDCAPWEHDRWGQSGSQTKKKGS